MDLTLPHPFWRISEDAESRTKTKPDPKSRSAPVFINDAVTPWGRETLLLTILRQQAMDRDSTKE